THQWLWTGLWAKWKSPDGEQVLSCTILTCGPNSAIGELRDVCRSFWTQPTGRNGWGKLRRARTSCWRCSGRAPTHLWQFGRSAKWSAMSRTMGRTWRYQFRAATNVAVEKERALALRRRQVTDQVSG